MTTRSDAHRPVHLPSVLVLAQGLLAILAGVLIFVILLGGLAISFNMFYAGQIYPGVSVAGVNLSGLEPEEAGALLAQRLTYPQQGRITID